ncbi:hypothetical protein ACRALDRAFT_213602 [Sodiomyces alcalophilus JCM 7366]|uniref:uncharacterized protein n=1 Tax=Sodiomyces alcalophilus JCM 7366 TaxID=591952 RepID=UPI0039B50139
MRRRKFSASRPQDVLLHHPNTANERRLRTANGLVSGSFQLQWAMWRLPFSRPSYPALAGCPQVIRNPLRPRVSEQTIPLKDDASKPLVVGKALDRLQSTDAATASILRTDHLPPEPYTVASNSCQRPPIFREFPVQKSRAVPRRNYQPSLLLETAVRIFHTSPSDVDSTQWETARFLATLRDPRLAIVTAQMVLHCAPDLDSDLRQCLPKDSEWDARLSKLDARGFRREDVVDWAHILVAETQEEKVQRLLSSPRYRPAFLLNHILNDKYNHGKRLMTPKSLESLIEYCKTWYANRGQLSSDHLDRNWPDAVAHMILGRLFVLSRRTHPGAVLDIAHLAIAHMEAVSATSRSSCESSRYVSVCSTFNYTLQQLCIPPVQNPYVNLSFNWQAIVKLLTYSSGLKKALVTKKQSYQAIRQVLLAIRKSDAERETATALKTTWPPYRVLRNGMEEALPIEEYYSRTVKAGFMMQESGYAPTLRDIVTDVLGGLSPDGSPTIHTRSTHRALGASMHSVWAAQVRATRNAQEAWQAFQHPPSSKLNPNEEVYWELMAKLLAKTSSPHHDNLPGEGRETFPFDDSNLSEFEKARLRPPSVATLTDWMVRKGVPLGRRCLDLLLRHAENAREAISYIRRSSLQDMHRQRLEGFIQGTDMSPALVRDIPRTTLHAVVELCCRLQPNRTKNTRSYDTTELGKIHRALQITRSAWVSIGDRSAVPWETIMKTLARPNIMISNLSAPENSLELIKIGGQIMREAEAHCGLSLPMIESFGRVIQKAVETRLPGLISGLSSGSDLSAADREILSLFREVSQQRTPQIGQAVFHDWLPDSNAHQTPCSLIKRAQDKLKAAWATLAPMELAMSPRTLKSTSINNHMRTLAFLGDFQAMAQLAQQTIHHVPTLSTLGDPSRDAKYVSRALCAFRTFAEPMLHPDVAARLQNDLQRQVQSSTCDDAFRVHWPTVDEVGQYTGSDTRGHLRDLKTLLALVRKQRDGNGGGTGVAPRTRKETSAAEAARGSWEAMDPAGQGSGWKDRARPKGQWVNETHSTWMGPWGLSWTELPILHCVSTVSTPIDLYYQSMSAVSGFDWWMHDAITFLRPLELLCHVEAAAMCLKCRVEKRHPKLPSAKGNQLCNAWRMSLLSHPCYFRVC